LQLTEEQTFRLLDEGTIAGTWLNFEMLPPDGALLQDGDVIHIGRVGFRFQIHKPKSVEKPDVIPLASGQGGEEHLTPQS
jgi:predicted component of type VI protein secretion system